LSFQKDKKSISLNELIHRDLGMEQLDDRLCKNCNNSDTSEVTTSIHTHPDVLIIMLKHHEYINNEQGRVNTQVDFPINEFVLNQGFDNIDTTVEYDLFAAICHKESRDETSGHYTALCKIKEIIGSNTTTEILSQIISSIKKIEQRQRSCTILWYTFYST
jgi:ubiquitin C-terminal hydrolase